MRYRIEDIEGVGPSYGRKLGDAGIVVTEDLLKACGTAHGRKQVTAATGLQEKQLLKWANLADLMRVSGVGTQFSELLEAAGVDTVKELKHRKPENLAAKMREVNETKRLTRAIPPIKTVSRWVEQAKSLSPVISH